MGMAVAMGDDDDGSRWNRRGAPRHASCCGAAAGPFILSPQSITSNGPPQPLEFNNLMRYFHPVTQLLWHNDTIKSAVL